MSTELFASLQENVLRADDNQLENALNVLIDQIYLCEVNMKANSEESAVNAERPTTTYSSLMSQLIQNRDTSTTLQINVNSNTSVQSFPSNSYSNFLVANLPVEQGVMQNAENKNTPL